ncbi:hypothetical protein Q4S45_08315 [Massilia sp. R2A-15]|uniref:hypothetical protein n=1 Tax=Massilia sp. R2A-15 TaxID=3064278 RepID=UPI0027329000|nr:hypothetical protein [Massilia sp. R2A-15]WLI91109.1 hypothetical protein Q4S45_08315 [Massilia sp. R2A-15]
MNYDFCVVQRPTARGFVSPLMTMSTARNFIRQAKRDSIVIADLCKVHQALELLHDAQIPFGADGSFIDLEREIDALERALRLLGME